MKYWRTLITLTVALAAVASNAQAWSEAYTKGLTAAKEMRWSDARAAFQEAIAIRPEDQSQPTTLPGPVTEPIVWRGGSPYSPNFAAAYASYRLALDEKDDSKKTELFKTASTEMEMLLTKKQYSKEAFFTLSQIYSRTRNAEGQKTLEGTFSIIEGKADWKVDNSFMAPEEVAAIRTPQQTGNTTITPGTDNGGKTPISRPGEGGTIVGPGFGTVAGRVPTSPYKFALIIGNGESRLPEQKIPFATADCMALREALIQNAGYDEANVVVINNGTAEEIRSTAKALVEKMPNEATLFFYFTGVGANIDDKDYYAGIDTESLTDSSSMISKSELFSIFISKGTKIFAFHQVNRPVTRGSYFGKEIGIFGRVSQAQATIPGGTVNSLMSAEQQIGIYTQGIISVLNEFRSNAIPITEFAWQVFYNIRRGSTGSSGGGSLQTPTLPVITNMASDAKF